MRFRIRYHNGQSILNDATITSHSTIYDLKFTILLHIFNKDNNNNNDNDNDDILTKVSQLDIKFGYPPQRLLNDVNTMSLDMVGIRDGDTFIIDQLPSSSPQKHQQPNSTSSSSFNPSSDAILGEFVHVPESGAYLLLRQSPDDNSCLFHSISYILTRGEKSSNDLRKLAVNIIRNNPLIYTDVLLGRPRDEYCTWLSKPQSWGGAIELMIFSNHFQTEICSVDVLTMRIDRFGEGQYDKRAFVVYNSIHYDSIGLTYSLEAPREFDETIFPVTNNKLLEYAVELAKKLHQEHRYTDTARFTISCSNCGVGLKGQDAAIEHARVTGHNDFTEYKE